VPARARASLTRLPLVMKGSPVRVRASALKTPAKRLLVLAVQETSEVLKSGLACRSWRFLCVSPGRAMGWGGFTRGLRPARAVGVKAPHVVQLVDTIVGCSGRGELVGSEAVAGRWLFWLGFVVAVALAGVCAVAGAPLVGVSSARSSGLLRELRWRPRRGPKSTTGSSAPAIGSPSATAEASGQPRRLARGSPSRRGGAGRRTLPARRPRAVPKGRAKAH
jgi:hypothetical protein